MKKLKDLQDAGCKIKILFADLHAVMDGMKSTFEQIESRSKYYSLLFIEFPKIFGIDVSKIEYVFGSSFQYSPSYFKDVLRIHDLVTVTQATHAGSDVVKKGGDVGSIKLNSLLYPSLQALDEEYLGADIELGGNDQRKIFVHARKFLPKLGYKKRIHLMTKMLTSLSGDDKMSSSSGDKIDLLDSEENIRKKINKAFCADKDIDKNPLLDLGDILFGIHTLRCDFKDGKISPQELKKIVGDKLIDLLSPLRNNEQLQKLKMGAY